MTACAPVLAVALPLLAAPLISICGRWPNLREGVTLLTAAALIALVVAIAAAAGNSIAPACSIAQPLPALSLAFHVEPLGLVFALVASILWGVTSIYSIGYMRAHGEHNQTRFYAAFAVALGSTMGVAFAANLFTLFVFYEVLTLSTYPLVTHAGNDEARQGGRTYLGVLLCTSIGFLLLAILLTWLLTGTLDFTKGGILGGQSPAVAGLLLALFIFGIGKAAVMPFHRWLPAAMVAPTPVSALLHAVAVVKAGVFTVLKVVVYIFGIDFLQSVSATQLLLYVATATVLLASLVAMRQDNLKRRLAYSTVSQLGYIVLGALLISPAGVVGSALHIVTHAFGKITLFFAAGAILVAAHKTKVSELDGLGRRMPFTFAFFLLGSLSIIGLPPLGGFWSKWYLVLGTLEAQQMVALTVLLISSLLNIAYLLPIPARAFFHTPSGHDGTVAEAPVTCLLAMAFSSLACFVLFLFPDYFYHLANWLLDGGP